MKKSSHAISLGCIIFKITNHNTVWRNLRVSFSWNSTDKRTNGSKHKQKSCHGKEIPFIVLCYIIVSQHVNKKNSPWCFPLPRWATGGHSPKTLQPPLHSWHCRHTRRRQKSGRLRSSGTHCLGIQDSRGEAFEPKACFYFPRNS